MHAPLISLDKIQYTKAIYNMNYEELPETGGGFI